MENLDKQCLLCLHFKTYLTIPSLGVKQLFSLQQKDLAKAHGTWAASPLLAWGSLQDQCSSQGQGCPRLAPAHRLGWTAPTAPPDRFRSRSSQKCFSFPLCFMLSFLNSMFFQSAKGLVHPCIWNSHVHFKWIRWNATSEGQRHHSTSVTLAELTELGWNFILAPKLQSRDTNPYLLHW